MKKSTVDGWLSANRAISIPAQKLFHSLFVGTPVLELEFTFNDHAEMMEIGKEEGVSPRTWAANVIRAAIEARRQARKEQAGSTPTCTRSSCKASPKAM